MYFSSVPPLFLASAPKLVHVPRPPSVDIMGYLFKKHKDAGGAFGDADEEERAFSSSSK